MTGADASPPAGYVKGSTETKKTAEVLLPAVSAEIRWGGGSGGWHLRYAKKAGEERLRRFEAFVVFPTIVTLVALVLRDPSGLDFYLLAWVAVVAVVELIPVPMWRAQQVSMGFPVLMAVAFLYGPIPAGLAALVGSFDPREFRRISTIMRALFNRCQIALAVVAASAIFHSLADLKHSKAMVLILAALVAAIGDYLINTSLVAVGAGLLYGIAPYKVLGELRIGRLSEFMISYVGLGVLGLALAKFFASEGVRFWAVPIFVVPLLLGRQMFYRSKALEEAHKELQDREQVLRALSNRMAEERQDEREKIAAYLHDDLAQLLFKLSLQVDIARRHLATGKISETEHTLEEIKDTKARTSDRIRALIRDLHRSPLGRAGLADSLQSFILETARDTSVDFHTDVAEIELPPPIALLVYKIAHEGVMNALKHANAQNVWLTVKREGDLVELVLRDDGEGFDTDTPPPEGHFGLTMMRERALVGGGSFDLKSVEGEGTTVTVRFPTSWLQPEPSAPPASVAGNGAGGGPGTAPTPDGEPTRRSALASPR
jgi:signal transduction histidine kinase